MKTLFKYIFNFIRRCIVVLLFIIFFIGSMLFLLGTIPVFLLGLMEGIICFPIMYILTGKNYFHMVDEFTRYWKIGSPNFDMPFFITEVYSQLGRFLEDTFGDVVDFIEPSEE